MGRKFVIIPENFRKNMKKLRGTFRKILKKFAGNFEKLPIILNTL